MHLRAKMTPDELTVLDTAIVAENFWQVGEALGLGHCKKTTERQGKRQTLAAVKKLRSILAELHAA
jgi:hypothetical protein